MVDATNADGSARYVHSDLIAEHASGGLLRISFTADVDTLISDESYAAHIIAMNPVGNTSSNGIVKFSKCHFLSFCIVIVGLHYAPTFYVNTILFLTEFLLLMKYPTFLIKLSLLLLCNHI